MIIPCGFRNAWKICQLLHVLYGLKHVSCAWYNRIDKFFKIFELFRSNEDYNLNYCKQDGKYTTVLF